MSIFLKMKKIMGCHVIEVLTRMTGHAHRTGISALSLGINKLLLKKQLVTLLWQQQQPTLSTKLASTRFCFSLSSGPSMVTKKMLMPDSLASRDASSTLSVGHPSTSTTATLGAPPRFPLASLKYCLLM